MNLVIWLLTFVLVIISVCLVLLVLMQKSKSEGGVGAALGGGMTEATFGADTGNILATLTRNGTIAFFVICFGLYLAHIARHKAEKAGQALPTITAPAAIDPVPAASPEVAALLSVPTETLAPAPAPSTAPVLDLPTTLAPEAAVAPVVPAPAPTPEPAK